MSKIAVFYHCRLSMGQPHIDFGHASAIMAEQMLALKNSGLADAADYMLVGVNGGGADACAAASMAPEKAEVVEYPRTTRGEHPTLHRLQKWLGDHPDWYVMYHHCKGAIHKGEPQYDNWRRRMEKVCVHEWRRAVKDLDSGVDSVGAHWLTPEQFPSLVKSPFWGGNFWWAKASFLATLPPMPETAHTRPEFYFAESWIGLGPRRPSVRDYCPGWP